jgi:hypothetical protein
MSELTPGQALLVFGLLARHGEGPQAALMPTVKKADRDALVKARLIRAGKVGRGVYLWVEDAGWAWAGAHLGVALPPSQLALQQMLARLGEHLERTGTPLAEFIGSKPIEAAAPVTEKAKPARARKAATKTPDARGAILAAYSEITGGRHGRSVRFAELRALLPKVDRAAFDATLTAMHLEGGAARLMRIEDSHALTEADRQAALPFKGDVFHALWIEA